MGRSMTAERDPADWSAVIAVFFLALVWWRLGIPSRIYFDEVHYVTAARHLLNGTRFNPEHPMLGKTVLAGAIAWLGDKPLYWRAPSALAGAIGLFAFARLMWFATQRRAVTLAAQFLLATNFLWFVESRIAMLDMVMAMLAMVGLWLCVSALRRPATARVVETNRTLPPDFIIMKVDELSGGQPFDDIDRLISQDELRAISEHYKQVAGFSLKAPA